MGGWKQFHRAIFFTPDVISNGAYVIMSDAANKAALKKIKGEHFGQDNLVARKYGRSDRTASVEETQDSMSWMMGLMRPTSKHEPARSVERDTGPALPVIRIKSDSGSVSLGSRYYDMIHALTRFDNVLIDPEFKMGYNAAIFMKNGRPVASLSPLDDRPNK